LSALADVDRATIGVGIATLMRGQDGISSVDWSKLREIGQAFVVFASGGVLRRGLLGEAQNLAGLVFATIFANRPRTRRVIPAKEAGLFFESSYTYKLQPDASRRVLRRGYFHGEAQPMAFHCRFCCKCSKLCENSRPVREWLRHETRSTDKASCSHRLRLDLAIPAVPNGAVEMTEEPKQKTTVA
jgi:hypothetical protein